MSPSWSLATAIGTALIATTVLTPAHATILFDYAGFGDTTGLTLVGDATPTATGDGTVLRVTSAAPTQGGAAYSTTPVSLDSNATFSSTFQFRFTDAGGIDPADGITLVLAADPNGLGINGGDLGYGGILHSVAISFDTFNNNGNGISDGDSSNHVGVLANGSLNLLAFANPYNVNPCNKTSGYLKSGCMSNGDKWTANVSYNGSLLNVTVQDGTGAVFDAINNYAINIASDLGTSTAYVGFTGATGEGFENQDVLNWQFANTTELSNVPEPASLAMLGLGLGGLAMIRRRRAA